MHMYRAEGLRTYTVLLIRSYMNVWSKDVTLRESQMHSSNSAVSGTLLLEISTIKTVDAYAQWIIAIQDDK